MTANAPVRARPSRSRLAETGATISLFVVPLAVLALAVLAGAVIARSMQRNAPLGALLGAVALVILVLSLVAMALGGRKRIRVTPLPLFFGVVQRRYGALVERSVYGVGSIRDWSSANPYVGMNWIDYPKSDAEPEPIISPSIGFDTPEPENDRRQALQASRQAELEVQRESALAHRVERYDSFWKISEKYLNDGTRWQEIRDLNVGREPAPGVVITDQTDGLEPGWILLVPSQ